MSIVRRVLLGLLLLAPGACASGDREVDRGACERLREHVIDVRMQGVVDDRDAHEAAARQVLGDEFITRCVAQTSPAELDCSMSATSLQALHSCSSAR